jgi:hypothetical protein
LNEVAVPERVKLHEQLTPSLNIDVEVVMRAKSKEPETNTAKSVGSEGWRDDFMGNLSPIRSVLVTVNGSSVMIPNSAFSDLASVKVIKAKKYKSWIVLTVVCGEGGDSSTVEFKIEQSKRAPGKYQITERTLRANGFRDDVWERTVYHNNMWDNPDL